MTLSMAIAGLAGRLAHHHADDVRPACCGREQRAAPRAHLSSSRARLRPRFSRLRPSASAGCCDTSLPTLAVTLATVVHQRVPLRHRTQGILPAAGHRPPDRDASRRAQDISFQAHREEARRSSSTIVQQGSRGRHRGRLHRRQGATQHRRACSSTLKPLEEREADGRPGDRPPARQALRRSRARACSCSRCRTSASAAGLRNAAIPVHAAGDDLKELERVVADAARGAARRSRDLTDVNTDQQDARPGKRRW